MQEPVTKAASTSLISFDTHPDRYNHWRMSVEGNVATLAMNVNEDKGSSPATTKLNSYDLGVDIELYDALNRIRFETRGALRGPHFGARAHVLLRRQHLHAGQSTHGWKVNFCNSQ